MLIVKNVCKKFGEVVALDKMSITFEGGKIYGLVGPNGSGKSTLLNVLCGEIKPDSGSIFFNGHAISYSNFANARKHGIYVIPQDNIGLFSNLTVLENFILENEKGNNIFISNDTSKYFNDLKVIKYELLKTQTDSLSQVDKQKVAIEKSFFSKAKVIIYDESLFGLTNDEIFQLKTIFQQLKKYGTCIIIISHDIQMLNTITDVIVNIKDGRVLNSNIKKLSEIRGSNLMYPIKHYLPSKTGVNVVEATSEKEVSDKISNLSEKGNTILVKCLSNTPSIIGDKIFQRLSSKLGDEIRYVSANRLENIFSELSVGENILLGGHSFSLLFNIKKISQLVDKVTFPMKVKYQSHRQSMLELSGGNQQKVVLSKWIDADFQVVIFIEPFSGLDFEARNRAKDVFKNIIKSDKCIVIISNEINIDFDAIDTTFILN